MDKLILSYNYISLNKNNLSENNKKNILYFDNLRIISSFAVIIIHISATYYFAFNLNSLNWKIAFYFNGISRFSVPIFFMISGNLFLKKEITFRILFFKYINNLFIHYIIWSLIYSIYEINFSQININDIIFICFQGHYHLWYLKTTIGLYMIVPFLRVIIKKDYLLEVFLLLSFLFNFVIPIFSSFLFSYSKKYYDLFKNFENSLKLNFIKGYIFYYIFGFYINRILIINKYIRICIYIFGIIGLVFTTKIAYIIAIKQGKKISYNSPFNINILLYTQSIFIFFKIYFNNLKLIKIHVIKLISKSTFGVYLIHPLIIKILRKKNKYIKLNLDIIYRIPYLSIIVFIISLLISIFLKFIPFIGKYLI